VEPLTWKESAGSKKKNEGGGRPRLRKPFNRDRSKKRGEKCNNKRPASGLGANNRQQQRGKLALISFVHSALRRLKKYREKKHAERATSLLRGGG